MELPIVFISSTKEDLESYRQAAMKAASKAGFHHLWMDNFSASGYPPLQICLEKVKR